MAMPEEAPPSTNRARDFAINENGDINTKKRDFIRNHKPQDSHSWERGFRIILG